MKIEDNPITHNKILNFKLLKLKAKKVFIKEPTKGFNTASLKEKLGVDNNRTHFKELFNQLLNEKFIITNGKGKFTYNKDFKDNKYKAAKETNLQNFIYTGIVDKTKTGSAYIIVKDLSYDVYVPNRYMLTAMDGDTVRVELLFSKQRSKNDGKIIEIKKRAKTQFIGIYRSYANYSIVYARGAKDELEIFIQNDPESEIEDGSKVLVEITEWRGKINPSPWGKVIDVLSDEDTNDLEMKTILVNNGFYIDFPEEVITETTKITSGIDENEIARRRDFRNVLTFTIDPDTAQDFDDAISYRILDNGNIEIGVHIADVSHYLRERTVLDTEAYKRSTSVYLVDRVAPMLPEKLSNELCSLRPHEESLTFSVVFEFDMEYKLIDRWFGKTIIHSDRRFSYEEVQKILDDGYGEYVEQLTVINEVAKKLRKSRFEHGSIDFDTEEVKFKLDEKGNPIEIYVKERLESHMLIEEFMLLANKEVATFIVNKSKKTPIPFIYRIHDLPNKDKLVDFANFTKDFGLKLKLDNPAQVVKSFNILTNKAENDKSLSFLIPLALRTMAKAVYSPQNIGHFGLGFANYSHFTSPIRRYSDVIAHRILFNILTKQEALKIENLEEKCNHISEQERKAINAERESIKYKQVQYISSHLGETFDGIISGFVEKGMFVEILENKVEGMVEFKTLGQYYILNEAKNKVVSSTDGHIYKMGDKVKIQVFETDIEKKRVDLRLIEE